MQVKITGIGGAVIHYPDSHDFYETRQQFAASIKLKNPPELNDWTIEFQILGNKLSETNSQNRHTLTGIPKRGITCKATKEKLFAISVPIPNSQETSWGLSQNSFAPTPNANLSACFTIKKNMADYSGLDDYVWDCVASAVQAFLAQGFTLNGKKVILKTE